MVGTCAAKIPLGRVIDCGVRETNNSLRVDFWVKMVRCEMELLKADKNKVPVTSIFII